MVRIRHRAAAARRPTVLVVVLTDMPAPVGRTGVVASGDGAETPQSTAGPDVIPTSVSAGDDEE